MNWSFRKIVSRNCNFEDALGFARVVCKRKEEENTCRSFCGLFIKETECQRISRDLEKDFALPCKEV